MDTLIDVELQITSPAFHHGQWIPEPFSYDDKNIHPPLHVENLPEETQSMALIMEDPDAPGGPVDHWVVWNIIPTNEIVMYDTPGVEGVNSFGRHNYHGPHSSKAEHRYLFRIFALNKLLNLDTNSNKQALFEAMEGSILASGDLEARYRTGQ